MPNGDAKRLTIATLGPIGTHSESATREYASSTGISDPNLVFGQVRQCLSMIDIDTAQFAVLPAENLLDGLIGTTFDAIIDFHPEIGIFDEIRLSIVHVLAVSDLSLGAEIMRVYSHPSALNQCLQNLSVLAPSAQLIPVGSTSEAATRLIEESRAGSAAVCSHEAARNLGLEIIAENIGDFPDNETRFLVCGRQESWPTGEDRTWLAIHYGINEPGQLYCTTKAFAHNGVDLTSVHSRPFRGKPHAYVLIFELEGHYRDKPIKSAVEEIAIQVEEGNGWLKVLGSHPARTGL